MIGNTVKKFATNLRQPSCRVAHPYSIRAYGHAAGAIRSNGPGLKIKIKINIKNTTGGQR
jgi:hypothetical protein